tara:strand:- start:1468 stop:1902 length:435 start_codon:yes stop_codon:yes gene_type:complete
MESPCSNLDKRTNAYKECIKFHKFKENFEDDNTLKAGDVIEKITTKTGIKKVVKWLAGEDCGCKERKEKANKLKIKIHACPTEKQYKDIKALIDTKPTKLTIDEQRLVVSIQNHVFGTNNKVSKCGSCYKGMLNKLTKMIELYS